MEADNLSVNSSSSQQSQVGNLVLVRVGVPDLSVEKCLQFSKDEVVWEVKQQALAALPKVADWFRELEESFNYGLFFPPANGKAGKFLDEERRLSEYPFPGPIGYLELKYKRRVYKMLHLDEKQLKAVNSKASRKKFADHVANNNVDKVNKMCAKGLDPNFHCQDSHSGETPLTLAVGIKSKSSKMLIALVNGGAIVDFRHKNDGSTAMHRAVTKNSIEALQTLLDLGASPNYKDLKGLSPLYYCVTSCADVVCCELLLHDRSTVGATDLQGWQEVHQACRNGLVAHLEQLLYYGADLNARNASGNTPLHVCAVNNQESCARTLLFRGADKDALNFAGQTPYQVAVIAGNLDLADVIQRHKMDDVVPFKEAPKFNPRRRTSAAFANFSSPRLQPPPSAVSNSHQQPQYRLDSSPRGGAIHSSNSGSSGDRTAAVPSSPSPSDRSLPPFSSGSSISETTSTGSGSSSINPQQLANGHHRGEKAKSLLQQSLQNSLVIHEDEHLDSASALAVSIGNDSLIESESLSSGVGTSSHSGSAGSSTTPTESQTPSLILPGMHVVCLENFSNPELANGLHITQGDIIEVTSGEDNASGMLEGILRGQKGFFPSQCVQEVRLRNPHSVKQGAITTAPRNSISGQGTGNKANPSSTAVVNPVGNGVGGNLDNANLSANQRHFATAQRPKDFIWVGEPRTAVLHKGKKGFGFVLRGAKAASPLMEMIPSEKCPGLQYMDDVDPGGVADMAGLRKGDFLLEINAHDVRQASHETVVQLIRQSGDLVKLTVVTVAFEALAQQQPLVNNNNRQYSTLPRKMNLSRVSIQPPPPPKRDPSTTLSVGRARARSMVANMAALEALDKAINDHDSSTSESVTGSVDSVQRMPDLVIEANGVNNPEEKGGNKTYASVAEMKRMKLQASSLKTKSSEDPSSPSSKASQDLTGLKKGFSSTPDLKVLVPSISLEELKKATTKVFKAKTDLDLRPPPKQDPEAKVADQRGYFTLPSRGKLKKLPPPTMPPPPIPQSEVVVVKSPEKTKVTSPVMSSFKPESEYESLPPPPPNQIIEQPLEVVNDKRSPPMRANSMPPRAIRPQVLKKVPETGQPKETYNINGVNYTTYTTFMSPLTPDEIPDVTFVEKPVIPEPDYHVHEGSKTLERKKKKSVSFLEDISKKEESSVKRIHSNNKKPESILKTEPSHCQHGKPILRPTPALTGDKYMQPIERIPRLKIHPIEQQQQQPVKTVVKVVPEDKIRIEVTTNNHHHHNHLMRSNSTSVKSNNHPETMTTNLQKSQSFCAEKASKMVTKEKSSSTGISENDIINARSSLKPSRSFPNELNDNDNSSSGVSSDQEIPKNGTSTTKFVTYLPVESSTPITKKAYDSESSESSLDYTVNQKSGGEVNIGSMKKMLHPKLAAIFDMPSTGGSYSSQTLPNRHSKELKKSKKNTDERSISESLALINQHVTSLGEVNTIVSNNAEVAAVLAPPPGFSDPESYSDNESLSSNGSKYVHHHHHKNNTTKVSFSTKTNPTPKISKNWNMTRSMEGFLDQSVQGLINANDVMSKSMDYAGFHGTISKKQQKGFRGKPLMGWTMVDVCDWLDSLFLPEYKPAFIQAEVDGLKLAGLTKSELEALGVIRVGHMLNIERSLKRYLEVTY